MLALSAIFVAVVALVQRFAPRVAFGTFDDDPGVRALGLGLLIVGWFVYVSARLTATGARRAVGRIAAVALFTAGFVRVAGPGLLSETDGLLPSRTDGARSMVGAIALLSASLFVFVSSPARRAARRAKRQ